MIDNIDIERCDLIKYAKHDTCFLQLPAKTQIIHHLVFDPNLQKSLVVYKKSYKNNKCRKIKNLISCQLILLFSNITSLYLRANPELMLHELFKSSSHKCKFVFPFNL